MRKRAAGTMGVLMIALWEMFRASAEPTENIKKLGKDGAQMVIKTPLKPKNILGLWFR